MPRDKVLLAIVFFVFGVGITLAVRRSSVFESGESAGDTSDVEQREVKSSVDRQEGGRSVKREPELEQMFMDMGYDYAFVYRFHGGFLAVDLFPIGEDATPVSVGRNWPEINGNEIDGRLIVLFSQDGKGELSWQCEGHPHGTIRTNVRPIAVFDRAENSASPPYKTGLILTGFDSDGELESGAFDGLKFASGDAGPFPPGLTTATVNLGINNEVEYSDVRTIFSLRWLDDE